MCLLVVLMVLKVLVVLVVLIVLVVLMVRKMVSGDILMCGQVLMSSDGGGAREQEVELAPP